jgi:hypothetical protein
MSEKVIKLKHPPKEDLKEIRLRRPKVRDLKEVFSLKGLDDFDKDLLLVEKLSGIPKALLEELDIEDWTQVQKALAEMMGNSATR